MPLWVRRHKHVVSGLHLTTHAYVLRVAFQVLPNIVAQPKPSVRWQYLAAVVLFGLTLLSATQLGLLANVSKLPKVSLSNKCCVCKGSRLLKGQHFSVNAYE